MTSSDVFLAVSFLVAYVYAAAECVIANRNGWR